MSTANPTLPPATRQRGPYRWVSDEDRASGLGDLEILDPKRRVWVGYTFAFIGNGYRIGRYDAKEGLVLYDLPLDLSSCDCGAAAWRGSMGPCKHQKALSHLLGIEIGEGGSL